MLADPDCEDADEFRAERAKTEQALAIINAVLGGSRRTLKFLQSIDILNSRTRPNKAPLHPRARAYVRAREARRIPHVLVAGRSFHEPENVIALCNVLAAIEWPDDELWVLLLAAKPVGLLARTGGLLLDPVYSGKAMAGLLALGREGFFSPYFCIREDQRPCSDIAGRFEARWDLDDEPGGGRDLSREEDHYHGPEPAIF